MSLMQENPPEITQTPGIQTARSRLEQAQLWASEKLGLNAIELTPVSGDASFRRYYRLNTDAGPLILMDALPEKEDSQPFLDVSQRLRQAGLHAPEILHFDLESGFGLIEDLGDELYKDVLTPENVEQLFPGLFRLLVQFAQQVEYNGLPDYDHSLLQQELDLFTDWYLLRHKQLRLSRKQKKAWLAVCNTLKSSASEQPQVFVHRDFHSCNLLYCEGKEPGIIDFQDAVRGPVSYDLISLVWDRYIAWPENRLENWMETFRQMLGIDITPEKWLRWCELMGLQRNLKIVGIFARLHYRDGKQGYLEMIPGFYQYLLDILPRYPEFRVFLDLLEQAECAP